MWRRNAEKHGAAANVTKGVIGRRGGRRSLIAWTCRAALEAGLILLSAQVGAAAHLDESCLPQYARALPAAMKDDARFHETVTLQLDTAAEEGSARCVSELLKAKADVEGPFYASGRLSNYSPLMKAARHGHLSVVRALLAAGAQPNLAWAGVTPLHEGASGGSAAVVRLLIKHGAKVNAVNSHANHFTPLHSAARDCRTEAAKVLLAYGADTHARTGDGATAQEVARSRKCEAVALLLAH
jgi:ankyrin repeat protein